MSLTLSSRLALGVSPRDPIRNSVAGPLEIAFDGLLAGNFRQSDWPASSGRRPVDGLPRLTRGPLGRHALLRDRPFPNPLGLRVFEDTQTYVPRRLVVTIPPAQALTIEPAFFPGAAYPLSPRSTGVRGRVLDAGGEPLRWVRIVARREALVPGTGQPVGVAYGDHLGQFLLVVEPDLVSFGALQASANVELTVFTANAVPAPADATLRLRDRYWDVPIEVVPPADPVAAAAVIAGTRLPPTYTVSTRVIVSVDLGFLRSEVEIVFP